MEIRVREKAELADWDRLTRWERSELGRKLRRSGLSYGEIMELIPVPKGTLAGWCREIRLTDEQVNAIKRRTGSQLGVPRDTQWRRRLEIEEIQKEARQFALHHLNDPLWVAGTALYWGEGSKTNRSLELANADPRAHRLFVAWTTRFLDPDPAFVLALHLHANNDEPTARRFWQNELRLEHVDFTKSFIKPDGTGHRKNHLPHGVCRVRLRRSTDAFLKVLTWIDVLADRWP